MKKLAIVVGLAALGTVGFLALRRTSDIVEARATPSVARVPVKSAEPSAQANGTPARSDAEQLTAEELAVMDMYHDVSSALTTHAGDCEAMADAVDEAVVKGEPAVQAFQKQVKERNSAEVSAAEERLALAVGKQTEQIRLQLSEALGKCSDQLLPVLKRLSAVEPIGGP